MLLQVELFDVIYSFVAPASTVAHIQLLVLQALNRALFKVIPAYRQ